MIIAFVEQNAPRRIPAIREFFRGAMEATGGAGAFRGPGGQRNLMRIAVWPLLLVLVGACQLEDGRDVRTPVDAASDLYALALTDRRAFAERLVSGADSELQRSQAVAAWFAKNFDWTSTDYEERSVQKILERRGGNCAELARVTTAMLDELGIEMRQAREINIHAESEQRHRDAAEKVAELGNAASVFGKRHNDHVWLEIKDKATGEWFPADPSLGVVGEEAWLAARFGFGERFTLDPTSVDMIAPFAVFAVGAEGRLSENRTTHYVIEGFNHLYEGRLQQLPAWRDWVRLVDELDDQVLAAFRGQINLHDYEAEIDALAASYEQLEQQLAERFHGNSEMEDR